MIEEWARAAGGTGLAAAAHAALAKAYEQRLAAVDQPAAAMDAIKRLQVNKDHGGDAPPG